MMIGTPRSSRNCLGWLPPSRVPFPAATTMATFIQLAFSVGNARQGRSGAHLAQRPARSLAVADALSLIAKPAEDHLSGGSLEHAGCGRCSIPSDQAPRIVH